MSVELVKLKFDAHVGSTLANVKALSDAGQSEAVSVLVDALVEGARAFLKAIDGAPVEKPVIKAKKDDKDS